MVFGRASSLKGQNMPRNKACGSGSPVGSRLPVALLACVGLGIAAAAVGRAAPGEGPANWPRLRGPDAAGHGLGVRLPAEWPETAWAWTAPLPGTGNASPVIWQGQIYVVSAVPEDGSKRLTCLSAADGRVRWERSYPGSLDRLHKQNSLATSTPVANESGVYWLRHADGLVHAEAVGHDGRPLWSREVGPFAGEHGFGASPALWRDLLVVPSDTDGESFVVGLATADGSKRWRIPRETTRTAYSTPLVLEGPGDAAVVVLASMSHGLTGLDPRDGRMLWERKCFPKRTVSSPVLVGLGADRLVLGSCGEGGGDNTLVALRLPPLGAAPAATGPLEPEIAWQVDRSASPYVPTALAAACGIVLWGDRGVVTCVDPASGAERWKGRVGGNYSASPIRLAGTILNVSSDGEIVTLADGEAFEVLGRTPLGEPSRATPAVAGSRVVFRGERSLWAIDGS
jgi:outer membrane protein assembly factor BamB